LWDCGDSLRVCPYCKKEIFNPEDVSEVHCEDCKRWLDWNECEVVGSNLLTRTWFSIPHFVRLACFVVTGGLFLAMFVFLVSAPKRLIMILFLFWIDLPLFLGFFGSLDFTQRMKLSHALALRKTCVVTSWSLSFLFFGHYLKTEPDASLFGDTYGWLCFWLILVALVGMPILISSFCTHIIKSTRDYIRIFRSS